MMRQPSENCFAVIRRAEGLRLKAYLCPAGIPSIGYGHTRRVKPGDRCTPEQAEAWLRGEDIAEAMKRVERHVRIGLTQGQADALVSFAYNTKEEQFAGSTLVRLVNAAEGGVAAAQFARWVFAKDPKSGQMVKLAGLVQRRAAEAALFRGEADFLRSFA